MQIEGKNGIKVTVVADSINEKGERITTFELEYHRYIHSEVLTHRLFSKNASSSRAVPLASAIDNIKQHPAIPTHFGRNQPGMMSREEFSGDDLVAVKTLWQKAMDSAIEVANLLNEYKPHKQFAARILEPFQLIKVVMTGTDWQNMLWLRDDEEAQPEFQVLASCIKTALQTSTPVKLSPGDWHVPYVDTYIVSGKVKYRDSSGADLSVEDAKKISASCCAQVSYRKLNDSKEKAMEIFSKLFSGRKPHMSPTEHQATPMDDNNIPFNPNTWQPGVTHVRQDGSLWSGNLRGWVQHRQLIANEAVW